MASIGQRLGTSQTQDFVLLGALALAGYVVYNLISGVKKTADVAAAIAHAAAQAGQAVNDSVVSSLAKVYTAATLPPNIVPTGTVRLPNGALLAAAQLPGMTFDPGSNSAGFTWLGTEYILTPGQYDAQGNLLATEMPDFGLIDASGGWS